MLMLTNYYLGVYELAESQQMLSCVRSLEGKHQIEARLSYYAPSCLVKQANKDSTLNSVCKYDQKLTLLFAPEYFSTQGQTYTFGLAIGLYLLLFVGFLSFYCVYRYSKRMESLYYQSEPK